eukprot:10872074-Alexandrium_andersonii.AAC.1
MHSSLRSSDRAFTETRVRVCMRALAHDSARPLRWLGARSRGSGQGGFMVPRHLWARAESTSVRGI